MTDEIPDLPQTCEMTYLASHRPLTRDELKYRIRHDPDPSCQPGADWTADAAHAKVKAMAPHELVAHYRDRVAWHGYERYLTSCAKMGQEPRYKYCGNQVWEKI